MSDHSRTTAWQPVETAPRSMRVLVGYRSRVVEIAQQCNYPNRGWIWLGDDGEIPDVDDPVKWWAKIPELP